MFKDFTKANYLTLISIIIATLVMLFGNNFLEKFQKAKLYYVFQDVKLEYPKESIIKLPKKIQDSVLNYYREIRIINVKSKPASDLKIFVNPNGEAILSKIISLEDSQEYKIDSGIMKIKIPRLVKGADIICQFWFKQRPGAIIIKYIDDEGVKDIKHITERSETNYLVIFSAIGIFLLVAWIFYGNYISPLLTSKAELTQKNIELQEKYDNVNSQLEELKPIQVEPEEKDVLEELRKILASRNKV